MTCLVLAWVAKDTILTTAKTRIAISSVQIVVLHLYATIRKLMGKPARKEPPCVASSITAYERLSNPGGAISVAIMPNKELDPYKDKPIAKANIVIYTYKKQFHHTQTFTFSNLNTMKIVGMTNRSR